jgi:hypothetical protein
MTKVPVMSSDRAVKGFLALICDAAPREREESINMQEPRDHTHGRKTASLADMYDREDLRDRGWTRAQINALPPDLVIQPTKTNHLIESRRLWDRQRVEQIDQQSEWKERRAELDAAILAEFGRDQAAARAKRLADRGRFGFT